MPFRTCAEERWVSFFILFVGRKANQQKWAKMYPFVTSSRRAGRSDAASHFYSLETLKKASVASGC